jgi:hypothetical protein
VRRLWVGVSQAPSRRRGGTYAAKSGHRAVARAPRSESEPRELNWLPARESSVVVAGIVSGCADFSARSWHVREGAAWRREDAGCWGHWGKADTRGREAGRLEMEGGVVAQQKMFGLEELLAICPATTRWSLSECCRVAPQLSHRRHSARIGRPGYVRYLRRVRRLPTKTLCHLRARARALLLSRPYRRLRCIAADRPTLTCPLHSRLCRNGC